MVQATTFADSARRPPGVGQIFGVHSLYLGGLGATLNAGCSRAALGSASVLRLAHQPLLTNYRP